MTDYITFESSQRRWNYRTRRRESDWDDPTPGELAAINAALASARAQEGQPLAEEYLFSDSASSAVPLRLRGVERGLQSLRGTGRQRLYVANLDVSGNLLPPTLITPRLRVPLPGDLAFGSRVATGVRPLDDRVTLRSRSARFVSALVRSPEAPALAAALDQAGSLLQSVRIYTERGNRVAVEVAAFDSAAIALGVRLSRALLPALDTIAESSTVYVADEAVAIVADAATLEPLIEKITHAVSWLSGHAARVGDSVEARLQLSLREDLSARLVATPKPSGLVVRVEATLPQAPPGKVTLSPEEGFVAKLQALFETKLDHNALDAAYVVRGDRAVADLMVTRGADELLTLREHDATVELDARGLIVELTVKNSEDEEVYAAAGATLELWRHVVEMQLGLDHERATDLGG